MHCMDLDFKCTDHLLGQTKIEDPRPFHEERWIIVRRGISARYINHFQSSIELTLTSADNERKYLDILYLILKSKKY